MPQLTASKTQKLTTVAAEPPPEKVEELDEIGPPEFVDGELEELLNGIEEMRLLDMNSYD